MPNNNITNVIDQRDIRRMARLIKSLTPEQIRVGTSGLSNWDTKYPDVMNIIRKDYPTLLPSNS
jgi:hypothetical protein